MKNIHVLPTNKPSRLWFNDLTDDGKLILSLEDVETCNNQHIYITSNSAIQIGDEGWLWSTEYGLCKFNLVKTLEDLEECFSITDRKIILTTDPELINDNVQAIHDELFLGWFCSKNGQIDSVEVKRLEDGYYASKLLDGSVIEGIYEIYEIILPKEEPKQYTSEELKDFEDFKKMIKPEQEPKPHSFCETPEEKCTLNYCDENGCLNRKRELVEPKQENCCTPIGQIKRYIDCKGCDKKPKQGTLEEAILKKFPKSSNQVIDFANELRRESAKWQQEQNKNKYSEEEVLKILLARNVELGIIDKTSEVEEWFNRFKKK
jgi:hypothetical protein